MDRLVQQLGKADVDSRMGAFQFCYVRGQIDYRPSTRDDRPCIEFTWDGNDEMDPAQGRGWAAVDGDELDGMIVFHMGDESEFKARRVEEKSKRKRK